MNQQTAEQNKPTKPAWLGLLFWLLVCFAASAIGGFATSSSVDNWYPTLTKPSFNPPSWVFAPVWTLLYAMMAVAIWQARKHTDRTLPTIFFTIQLVLNVAWSLLFFGLHSPAAAMIEIAFLWKAIGVTTALFYRHSRLAAALMVPYLLWVTFAAVLNVAIWYLNH